MKAGYLYHEIYGWHDAGTAAGLLPSDAAAGLQPFAHLETPESKRRLHELVVVSGLADHLVRLTPRPATEEQLLLIHTEEYLERMRAASGTPAGGDAGDGISRFGKGGFDIMRLAAGGTIAAVEAVATGAVENAYALVRPSGHHAIAETGMGMAYFANLAIAARYARRELGVERIAIVDWDAHHGNGTQRAFYDSPDVLTISLHQDNVFPPGSGAITERGEGPGLGYSLNVPLPAGTGDGGYDYAMRTVVVPAVRRFRPDLILVASGLDAGAMDPLARQMLSSDGFRAMTRHLLDVAAEVCGGRVAMSHEGGYSGVYVPFCGLAVIEEMAGVRTVPDPYLDLVSGFGGQGLQPHQKDAVDRAAELVNDI